MLSFFIFLLFLLLLFFFLRIIHKRIDSLNTKILGNVLQKGVIFKEVLELLLLLLECLRLSSLNGTRSWRGGWLLPLFDRHLQGSLEDCILIFHTFFINLSCHVDISLSLCYWLLGLYWCISLNWLLSWPLSVSLLF